MSTPTGRWERHTYHAKSPPSVIATVTATVALIITAALKVAGVDALTAGMLWAQAIGTAALALTAGPWHIRMPRRTGDIADTTASPDAAEQHAPARSSPPARERAAAAGRSQHFHGPVVAHNANFGNQKAGGDIYNGDVRVGRDFHG